MPRPKAMPPKLANAARTGTSSVASAERADVLTLAEVAAYLRVSEAEILQAVRNEGLPARQFGPEWRFLKSALQEWLSAPVRRNQGLLAHLGAIRDDPYLEGLLNDVYERRGRPETEDG